MTTPVFGSLAWFVNGFLPPFLAALFALATAAFAIRIERRKTLNQELIKKRIAIFDEMAPRLNAILCFIETVGDWANVQPPKIIDHKRKLDHSFHIYGFLFSPEFAKAYSEFMNVAFETFTGYGQPAKIRADLQSLRDEWQDRWMPDWDGAIARPLDGGLTLREAYRVLMNQFGRDIGVKVADR